jgi:polyhydroxyalkanoate synthesis regulator phasin
LTSSSEDTGDRGVGDALRDAVERTLAATATSASSTRERAGDLVDEITRRGREASEQLGRRGSEAREELTRRGQVAGAELAKRGQGAGAELARRLEALEKRLADVEEGLRREAEGSEVDSDDAAGGATEPNPKAED